MDISKHIAMTAIIAATMVTSKINAAIVNITESSSSGYYMTDGNTYVVKNSVTFYNSGMSVAENATVVIYVPKGVTLTTNGKNGSGASGGRAGINVPASSTLVITGEGTIKATGGNAGNGSNGENGSDGVVQGFTHGWSTSGAGGKGGNGGGGAGAGIGGNGGYGGSGGSGGASVKRQATPNPTNLCGNGNPGQVGGSGASGNTMGTVYVIGKITVSAKNGSAGSSGGSGSGGRVERVLKESAISHGIGYYSYGGGGGGGGGAGSSPTYGIGGGGASGGGGGGGGSGLLLGVEDFFSNVTPASGYQGYVSWGSGGKGGSPAGTIGTQGGASASFESTDYYGNCYGTYYSGAGGMGGTAGSNGGAGLLYVSSTATVNVNRPQNTATTHWAAQYTITFYVNGGTFDTSANSVTATLGCTLPSAPVPTRTGYTFGGFWTSTSGDGTQYFHASGKGARTWDRTSSTRLNARWTANIYTVTFDAQGGNGGTASISATYDSAMPSITIPTRTGYTFEGYWTETNGGGTQYYTASGVSARDWDKTFETTLYAKWSRINQLTIQSQFGTASPEPGHYECEPDSTIAASVAPPEATDGVRFNYLGWSGTGSVPASGTATNVSFVITEDSTLTWNWERLNRITIRTPLDGECGFGTQWILNGQTASATLTPPKGRYDMELVGDTNGVSISGTTLSIPSNAPKTIDAKMYSWNRLVGAIPWHAAESPLEWSVASDTSAEDGYSLRSDFAEMGTASTNSATLNGSGTLTFNWRISANRGDYARLFVDGVQKAQITRKPEWAAVSVNIEGDGDHLVSWVYVRKSTTAANDNAAYIDEVSWTPDKAATSTTPSPVPCTWLDDEAAPILSAYGGNYEDAANAIAANGVNRVWECFVAGISPTNEAEKFEARIAIGANGKPEVSWLPKLPPEEETKRIYRILGTKTLESGAQWSDVTSLANPDAEGYRFFKVSVEIPN